MAKILVADDEMIMRSILQKQLTEEGHEVIAVGDGLEAAEKIRKSSFDVIVLDNKMPGKSGVEVLRLIRERDKEVIVILITAFAAIEDAVSIMKLGADDYIVKPFDIFALTKSIRQALLAKERSTKYSRGKEGRASERVVGDSPVMRHVMETINKIKDLNTTVLITGESGTGKGVVAKEIHRASGRKAAPFIHVDCAALNPNLIESELFGYEKGAFTSASNQRIGKLELAGRGTVFLDEIGNLPPELQTKLLLVLEEREFYRGGGTKLFPLEARVISATNANLAAAVAAGTFREDLYYRLNIINIEMPPLRHHKEDIVQLARNFIANSEIATQKGIADMSDDFLEILQEYEWPGNVRELGNAIESALALCEGSVLQVKNLPLRITTGGSGLQSIPSTVQVPIKHPNELRAIIDALEQFDGHREKTANYLGISRRTLQYKLKKYGLL